LCTFGDRGQDFFGVRDKRALFKSLSTGISTRVTHS